MTVNILRLAYGMEDLDQLKSVLVKRRKKRKGRNVVTVTTRFVPKRADEAEEGGSLYWIVKGFIRARQKIIAIEEVDLEIDFGKEKRKRNCAIHLDPRLIPTEPLPRRPIQGWRYLEVSDAPPDLEDKGRKGKADLPPDMAAELKDLGLL